MPTTPADYFAIVGTGDELVIHNSSNEELERFQREIVELEIVVVSETTNDGIMTTTITKTLPAGKSGYEIVENTESDFPPFVAGQQLWQKGQQWEANLLTLRDQLELKKQQGIRAKVLESKLFQWKGGKPNQKYFLSYKRRSDDHTPAIADVQLYYVRLAPFENPKQQQQQEALMVPLQEFLVLPHDYEEWVIPHTHKFIQRPLGNNKPTTTIFDSEASGVEAQMQTEHELPVLVEFPTSHDDHHYTYIPVLAIRRQRLGDEERYNEDAAIVDIAVTIRDGRGEAVLPEEDDDEEDDADMTLRKTRWSTCTPTTRSTPRPLKFLRNQLAMPAILIRKNLPSGFADAAFATKVLDRFPEQNYKGMPLPEEELPMFCYPTGCRLHRARFSEAPVAQYYGFVLKNERGDSIYVSCVSFMEPLTTEKIEQLGKLSEGRRRANLAHRRFCERRENRLADKKDPGRSTTSDLSTEVDSNFLMTGFDDMTTFENKTICLISRYPYWSSFRKFLSHLHILSGASSDIPLERYLSHLLLSVPLPRPGGASVIVPLPALSQAMVMSTPPQKDFPLLDLSYQILFSCLEIKTVVMIVLGMLALERKVIVLSSRPSLVSDVCELLRSLLFPFELCAPYVPRLTEPFKSSLNFPGAIFVGIHDDGSPRGLASTVRNCIPEDSIVIDLDSGQIDCFNDRYETITSTWGSIPESERNALIRELQALCEDAEINDGQEPMDSIYDDAFEVALDTAVDGIGISNHTKDPLDDRAIRDAFLRFFCSVLGGYERYLVVPAADFLTSGDDWFDAKGFLDAAPKEKKAFLNLFVSTQMFQSFIQRRTEASDMHCMLFDECLAEFHSSSSPYGRLGGDVERTGPEEGKYVVFSLLVDQAAAIPVADQNLISTGFSFDASEAESSINLSKASTALHLPRHAESVFNEMGDLVTGPTKENLAKGSIFVHCKNGNPCFPTVLSKDLFLPREPDSWKLEITSQQVSLLARSDKELEEALRSLRNASSTRGQRQRRCLWQLPKLMGSQFLGSWLLCIPSLVSTPEISREQQSRYLAQALGAIRLLRSKQRIVPDEAAYRALMVACGRTSSDRRVELVKLFGLLRSDGIFPSAVTLGQYTKALADGYAKRLNDSTNDSFEEEYENIEVTNSKSKSPRSSILSLSRRNKDDEKFLSNLDAHLSTLEWHGRRWRNRSAAQGDNDPKQKRKTSRTWLPVVLSSSFIPPCCSEKTIEDSVLSTTLIAMWSRTHQCSQCGYIPLDEEIQAGWEGLPDSSVSGSVACPHCASTFLPKLGIKEYSLEEAKALQDGSENEIAETGSFARYPPQIRPTISNDSSDSSIIYVTYISPNTLRTTLEQYVTEYGEEVLSRDRLKQLDGEVFYNFFWYCARFNLPLPLPTRREEGIDLNNYCAFAAWDRSAAERGCISASKVIDRLLESENDTIHATWEEFEAFEEYPLLSQFNLQGFYSNVWDDPDTSNILVQLVEACDKRDFRPIAETVLDINRRRTQDRSIVASESASSATPTESSELNVSPTDFDLYKTVLYLSKYQCTSAFHNFFPTTLKACKGYHFWCATGTPLPMFDRLLREALEHAKKENSHKVRQQCISDIALGFRCVFGHLI